jgi:phasin
MKSEYIESNVTEKGWKVSLASPIGIKLNAVECCVDTPFWTGRLIMIDPTKLPNFDVPNEMRDLADKSIQQARRAFDTFMDASHEAVSRAKGSGEAIHQSAEEAGRKAVDFAEQNVRAALEHGQALVQAKGLDEVMRLQSDYMRSQIHAMQTQLKAMGEMAQAALKPKR